MIWFHQLGQLPMNNLLLDIFMTVLFPYNLMSQEICLEILDLINFSKALSEDVTGSYPLPFSLLDTLKRSYLTSIIVKT